MNDAQIIKVVYWVLLLGVFVYFILLYFFHSNYVTLCRVVRAVSILILERHFTNS